MTSPNCSSVRETERILDRHLVNSIAWTALVKFGSQVVSWACFLVVARLVAVSDFGLITMGAAFVGVISLIGEFGIGAAVVNLRNVPEQQIKRLNCISVLFGLAAFALTIILAVPTAQFFHAPQLVRIMPVMGLGFPLAGLRTVPQALMQRALKFKLISLIEAVQIWVQAAVTIIFALAGGGFWALVAGTLAGTACGDILPLFCYRPGFALTQLSSLSGILQFGSSVTISNVCWYLYSSADFAVAGRMLGKEALGAYSMAWTVATLPAEKLAGLIMRVMPGVLIHKPERSGGVATLHLSCQ